MKATWTGTISLGLLHVPVNLYTGDKDERVSFRQICPTHECRVEQRLYCKTGGEQVARDDVAKGFELEEGKFIVLTAAEIERAASPMSKVLDVEVCVPEAAVDPRYFDRLYIALPPKKDPGRVYALLRDALTSTGHIGIGRITMRTKMYLAAVRPFGDLLTVHLMLWPIELKPLAEFVAPDAAVKPEELALAAQLVEGYVRPFDPAEFVDEHSENVKKLIEARIRGETVSFTPQEEPKASTTDLAALLLASIAAAPKRHAA
ncbi:MAG TPA: Ku protein [Longimicrobium sp.]|nr:Ku protein [Longimicrobium sp.]